MSDLSTPTRTDFAFPFRIDAASGQAAQASYQDHVDQMIRQILLTDPGERVCLPTFGAGLRRLLFAPLTAQLQASATMIITQSLNAWLGNQITVQNVTVRTPASTPGVPDGTITDHDLLCADRDPIGAANPGSGDLSMTEPQGPRPRRRRLRPTFNGIDFVEVVVAAHADRAFPQRGRGRRPVADRDDHRRRQRADRGRCKPITRRRLVDRRRRHGRC